MNKLKGFVDEFRQFEFIRRGLDEEIEYWGENVPMMLLFSRMGKEIFENFAAIGPDGRTKIFSLIEDGVSGVDLTLQNYVATGLLEALDGSIRRARGKLKSEIYIHLGGHSKDYLIEWDKWSS